MADYELPLVIFTALSQTAVGLAVFLTWRRFSHDQRGQRKAWLITGGILALSLLGALFHLSYPFYAYNALINLKHAWLSRELIVAIAFAITIAIAVYTNGNKVSTLAATSTGVVLIIAQGMTYAAPAMAAVANGLPMVFYFLTAWVMGAACIPLLDKTPAVAILRQGILLFMLTLVIPPLIWSSGGAIMRMTYLSWGESLLFWGSILCFILAFILSCWRNRRVEATAVIALAGIVLSRLTFFGDTISTVINIGHPY
jgi:DMSO reductase anchor subunit